MSPASKSKSRAKSKKGDAKERFSTTGETSHFVTNVGHDSNNNSTVLGIFQMSDTSSLTSLSAQDGSDDNSGTSSETTFEFDHISNSSSCSCHSEDLREKPTAAAPTTDPNAGCDIDKRNKIRQKNGRKHRRKKEKRALELHERCIGLLRSSKLEALSNQLIAMGFPANLTTKSIIVNNGRMEESVAWLLQEAEENKGLDEVDLDCRRCAEIDISDEILRMDDMGVKYKCTKQEVEKAVVACDGDLLKAVELLIQNQANKDTSMYKSDGFADSTGSNNELAAPNPFTSLTRSPWNGEDDVSTPQKCGEERDLKHLNSIAFGAWRQPLSTTNWLEVQPSIADKRLSTAAITCQVLHPLASTRPVTGLPLRPESLAGLKVGDDGNASSQIGASEKLLDSRKFETNWSPFAGLGFSTPASPGLYSSMIRCHKTTGEEISCFQHNLSSICSGVSSSQQFFPKSSFQPTSFEGTKSWNAAGSTPSLMRTHSWNEIRVASSSLSTPTSLGLFSSWDPQPSKSSSQNDWSDLIPRKDYASVDWSLNLTPLNEPLECGRLSDTWTTMFVRGNVYQPFMISNYGGVHVSQTQMNNLIYPTLMHNSYEWIYVPRQYVPLDQTWLD